MKTVVFDFDGTLVDSAADIAACFCHSLASLGLEVPAPEAVYPYIGRPLNEMFGHFAAPEQVESLAETYHTAFPDFWARQTRPYPGVLTVLSDLRRRGYGLAVATTKRSEVVRAIVAALGLAGYFDFVQGTDGFAHKPAPDVVLRAVAGTGGEGVWMVGDTVADVLAGRSAGLKTYAVTWGTHDAATLREAGPDVLADDLAGLLEHL